MAKLINLEDGGIIFAKILGGGDVEGDITFTDDVSIEGILLVGDGAEQQGSAVATFKGDVYADGDLTVNGDYNLLGEASDANNTFRFEGYGDALYVVARSGTGSSAGTSIVFRTSLAGSGEFDRATINDSGSLIVGDTSLVDAEKLRVTGGGVNFDSLPTSDPVKAGELWNNSGVVNISAG